MQIAVLGAGFIGRFLLKSLLASDQKVSVLDVQPCPAEFVSKVRWVRGTFLNSNDVSSAIRGADVVYHLVSSTVPGDVVDEGEELVFNVVRTIQLLKMCVQAGVRRVIFISSASVYGFQHTMPITETALTNPISSHGIHKLTIEKYLQLHKYDHGLDCKIIRLSNPYGIGQNLYGRQGFIAIALGRLLSNQAINIRGDGTSVRDYIYIEDVVRVLSELASTVSEETIFNIGSGLGVTLNDVVAAMCDILGRDIPVRHSEDRAVDIPVSVLDISKAREVLGFKPSISLGHGLRKMFSFYQLTASADREGAK